MEEPVHLDELICRHLNGGASEAEATMLAAWRNASAANEQYIRNLERVLHLAEMSPLAWGTSIVAPALVRGPATDELVPIGRHGPWRRAGHWVAAGLVAAAGAALMILPHLDRFKPAQPALLREGEFASGLAETATVVLGDGTVVRLAPDSRLRVIASDRERIVSLDGRAFFAVAKMRGYPFRVRSQGGDAMVVGTRFEMTARSDAVRLVVVEGRVELGAGPSRVLVAAGEISRVTQGTVSSPERVADPYQVVDWLGNFLVFQDAPLRNVAVELGHAYGVKVEFTAPALEDLRVTGWYADRKLEDVLTLVCGAVQVACGIRDGRVTISR